MSPFTKRAKQHDYRVELLRGKPLDDLYDGQFSHHRAASTWWCAPHPFSRLNIAPGLSATLMHSGAGMSVGPALGKQAVAEMFEESA